MPVLRDFKMLEFYDAELSLPEQPELLLIFGNVGQAYISLPSGDTLLRSALGNWEFLTAYTQMHSISLSVSHPQHFFFLEKILITYEPLTEFNIKFSLSLFTCTSHYTEPLNSFAECAEGTDLQTDWIWHIQTPCNCLQSLYCKNSSEVNVGTRSGF